MKKVTILIVLQALVALFAAQSFAADCSQNFPNFSGTFKGTMSNSNYEVSAALSVAPDCSSISLHLYGVDRDVNWKYQLGPVTATVKNGVIHTAAALQDFSSLYLLSTDTDRSNPQSRPAYANLTVIRLTAANHLEISFLGGLLISFEGARVSK